jgi:hypothetical protein
MFHWRVDTNGVTFRAASDPTPVVKNRETGELAIDNKTKQTMFTVELLVKAPQNRAEVWPVKVAGEPEVRDGDIVQVLNLVGQDWENGGRHGISWRAEAIVQAGSGAKRSTPAAADVPPPPARKVA